MTRRFDLPQVPVTVAAVLLVCVAMAACRATTQQGPPSTRVSPVVDTYHGLEVTDGYRWLEDWSQPEVKAWSDAQNAYTRGVLDGFAAREAIRSRVRELSTDTAESYFSLVWRGGTLFALKRQPPKQQPLLITMASAEDVASARVLLDPTILDPSGSTTIDFYEPSWDGQLVAVSLSKGGSENGAVHIFAADGKEVHEVIERVNGGTAGGDLAWTADGAGFFYTRYPREGERAPEDLPFYQQVYFHKLGTPPQSDRYELGKELPRIAEIRVHTHATELFAVASVQFGDGGPIEHHLRLPDGSWQKVATADDRVSTIQFGPKRDLYLVSTKEAPRGKVLRISLNAPRLPSAQTVIAEGPDVIQSDFWEADPTPVVTHTNIFVPYQVGGPTALKSFGLDGAPQRGPELLPVSAVTALTRVADDLLFLNVSFTTPPGWYRFKPRDGKTSKTSLMSAAPFTFDDAEVVQKVATSTDQTKVPYMVIRPRGAGGKSLPTLVTGYGGYGVNTTPGFDRMNRLLLDQGFAVVRAVIRGGGEIGETWHLDGRLTKKQHVFDDFAAVLQQLIADRDTSAERLAIIGGSNGGLLMGATFTQHPELVRAVVSRVGLYDMLRVELSPNGAFNVPEFGTVRDREQFAAMHAYSPYHHVRDGTQYPAILFLTGANDPRVDPMQSRKMTARLQTSGTSRPVLLRTSGNTGHGIGTPLEARIEQDTDIYGFLFHELGVKFQPVEAD
jgi:prolyl oligopeptidase